MILLEILNIDGLVVFLATIMLGPPILLTTIGFAIKKKRPQSAKLLFIFAGLYLIIGLGICGGLLN